MITRDSAMAAFNAENVASAISWAFESACEQALEDFAQGTGYTALSAGVGRYDLLADRLDRVFSCGDYEVPEGLEFIGLDVLYEGLSERARRTMPVIPAGTVIRANLRGSNGWSLRSFRFVTHSFQIGGIERIDWTQASKTLQAVSRQAPAEPGMMMTLLDGMLDEDQRTNLAAQDALPSVPMPTLVLVHALDRDTGDRDLAIGHSRYNEDQFRAWHWQENLLGRPDPEEYSRSVPDSPTPSNDVPDVTVRLRKRAAEAVE